MRLCTRAIPALTAEVGEVWLRILGQSCRTANVRAVKSTQTESGNSLKYSKSCGITNDLGWSNCLSLLNNTGSLTTAVSWCRGVIEVETALSVLKTRYTWIDGSDLRFHKQIHAKTTLGLFTKYNFFPLLKTGFLFVASTEFPGALLCKLSSWFLASGSGGRHHTAWIALHSWPYETVMPKAGGMS